MLSADLSLLRENVTEGVVPVTDSAGDFSFSGVNSEKPEFRAAVGLSRKWDAREAGREVAIDTLNKLGAGVKPDFFLLFSTIHYEKWGGFKEFLNGVWDILPEGTPLIGGTVAGFMNNYGCYTRGATALAVSYPNMDVAVGVGHNTKRAPHIAAKECAGMIKRRLDNSAYVNKYFICLVSSAIVPNTPITKKRKVIRDVKGINVLLSISESISFMLQIGAGRDEEIVDTFSNLLKEYKGIGGASCDALDMEKNYQFFMSEVITNSIVSIGFSADKELSLNNSFGLRPTGRKLTITDTSSGGYIIKKINNKPAVSEYLRIMGWSEDILDERLYRKVFYYPLVQKKEGFIEPRMFGLVYGENFVFPMKPVGKEVEIYFSSGNDLLNSALELFNNKKRNSGFLVSCGTRMETLGNKSYYIKEILDQHFDSDYLIIYTAGEYIKKEEVPLCLYQSDNAIFF